MMFSAGGRKCERVARGGGGARGEGHIPNDCRPFEQFLTRLATRFGRLVAVVVVGGCYTWSQFTRVDCTIDQVGSSRSTEEDQEEEDDDDDVCNDTSDLHLKYSSDLHFALLTPFLIDSSAPIVLPVDNSVIRRRLDHEMAQKMLSNSTFNLSAGTLSLRPTRRNKTAAKSAKVGASASKKRKPRTSYSLAQKLEAVDEAQRTNLRTAAVLLHIDERVLRQWLVKADMLREAVHNNSTHARRLRLPNCRRPLPLTRCRQSPPLHHLTDEEEEQEEEYVEEEERDVSDDDDDDDDDEEQAEEAR